MESDNTDDSMLIGIGQMPHRAYIRRGGEDWAGVTDRKARKRLQNRLNQRARWTDVVQGRQRKSPNDANNGLNETRATASAIPSEEEEDFRTMDEEITEYNIWKRRACLKRLNQRALQSYLMSQPSPDHLLKVIQLNIINAFTTNATVLGLQTDWLICCAVSPFGQGHEGTKAGPQLPPPQCPAALVPTTLQMSIEHHPLVDLFPSSKMRDNFLAAMVGIWDEDKEDELWVDLVETGGGLEGTGLIVWGEPWDARNWEATVPFLRKWGWIIQGCNDLLEATNFWRRKRGERPLNFGLTAS
ncbi:hypothetical protein CT0861_06176 [Colletotrichum tofieldiae]|uniref:Uncharacterized protein n=1 Tax=Colletotrichum tofieldiae TaxID=708197 RepID=A0A166RJP6_9PEZI|nr:hypothetical protein CT0861_06176 [Colletotrichum tofieldiae]GKT92669.1 hypothetical protein Ct61P_10519 [Colletotrichum tofieldiae]